MAKQNGALISNTSEDRFDELTQIYESHKVSSHLEFDTSVHSSQHIADVVIEHIRSK